jgi:DNA-binding NarL/FixJ family response regulator
MYVERATPLLTGPAGQQRDTILVIDSRILMRDCIMHVLRAAFPDHEVIDGRDLPESSSEENAPPRLVIIGQYGDDPESAPCELDLILERFGKTPVVLMAEDDDQALRAAVTSGCRGFVPRSLSLDIAVAAFRLVMVGGTFFPRPLAEAKPAEARSCEDTVSPPLAVTTISSGKATASAIMVAPPAAAAETPSFTPREWQIVESLQLGKSNKIIAADLNLSENTVKVHVRHVMRKLRATNRTQAALRSQTARRLGV